MVALRCPRERTDVDGDLYATGRRYVVTKKLQRSGDASRGAPHQPRIADTSTMNLAFFASFGVSTLELEKQAKLAHREIP